MTPGKFDCPLTHETFESFVRTIFAPIERGQSAVVKFETVSGSRSLSKYLIKNFASFEKQVKKGTENYELFFIDDAEMTEPTALGYLLLFYQQLCPDSVLAAGTYFEVFNKIKKCLEVHSKEKELVFFLHHFDELPFMASDLGTNLKALWQIDKNRIHFLFLTYEDIFELNDLANTYGKLTEVLMENHVKLPALADADVDYVISRQSFLVDITPNKAEIAAIKKVSGGNPYLIKTCCRILSQNKEAADPYKLLENHYQTKLIQAEKKKSGAPLKVDKVTGVITQGNKATNLFLSAKQYDLLAQFLLHPNEILTRDQIGEILWGKNSYEKYSDWAIDQMIHELRDKLATIGKKDKLKTIRDKGYSFKGE